MPKLGVFNSVSLDGYLTGTNGDLSWAHSVPQDAEWNAFRQCQWRRAAGVRPVDRRS